MLPRWGSATNLPKMSRRFVPSETLSNRTGSGDAAAREGTGRHDWPAVRDYPYWPGGRWPPHTGRMYDWNRLEGPVTNHSLENREESIYRLLDDEDALGSVPMTDGDMAGVDRGQVNNQ
jgi:hypothetical protein